MKPLALDVRAFRGFRAPFTIPLGGGGLTLVEGENLDAPEAFTSNGSGKSLLVVEAPMWALFDRTVRYGERAITSEITHPTRGADVSFNFSQGSVTYSATRTRTPKGSPKFTLTQDGQPYPLSRDPVTARREMAEILGFDYISFRHAVIVQGGDSLASAGFASQMGVLEMILRTFTLAKAADRASQAAIAADREVASAEGTLRAVSDALTRAERAVQEAEDVVQKQPDPSLLMEQIKLAEHAAEGCEGLREQALQLHPQLEEVRARIRTSEEYLTDARRTELTARSALTTLACPTCKRPYDGGVNPEVLRRDVDAAQLLVTEGKNELTKLQQAERDLVRQADAVLAQIQAADAAFQRAEVLRAQLDGMDLARRVAVEALDRAKITSDEAARAAEAALADVAQTQARASQFRFWAKGFSRTDLQADLVASATPVLNEAAARHAQTLTAGQILVTFDPFRATNREDLVRIAGASAPTYAGLSRGEKERVDLIIALSLRDLARWRLPEPVQFAVYDEVFDHCDAAGLRAIAGMLQADAARGATVIVVTHNPNFKMLFPQAKLLRVIKRGGEAEVEVRGL